MYIERTSPFTGITRIKEIDVTWQQLENWKNGMLIQKAMPHLSDSDREYIMTGITDEEWDEEFKDD